MNPFFISLLSCSTLGLEIDRNLTGSTGNMGKGSFNNYVEISLLYFDHLL